MTLSYNKFFVYHDPEAEFLTGIDKLFIRCTVCGHFNETEGRLDDLVQWAEQHECALLGTCAMVGSPRGLW